MGIESSEVRVAGKWHMLNNTATGDGGEGSTMTGFQPVVDLSRAIVREERLLELSVLQLRVGLSRQ